MTSRFDDSLFSAYLDDEATVEERAAVEKQLNESGEARAALQDLQELSRDLQSLPKRKLPEHFARRVLAAAEREMLLPGGDASDEFTSASGSRVRWSRSLVPLLTTAAALLLALSLLDWNSQRQPTAVRTAKNRKPARSKVLDDDRVAANKQQPGKDLIGSRVLKSTADFAGAQAKVDRKSVEALRPAYVEPLVPPITLSPQQSARENGRLAFVDDLRKLRQSDIGRVLTALEPTPDGVAVVKLTVVDCREGVNALQLLLSRNDIHLQPSNETRLPNRLARSKAFKSDKGKSAGVRQFVAVYVESTSERLARAVAELKSDRQFRRLEVARPLALAQLDRSIRNRLDSRQVDEPEAYAAKKRRFHGHSAPSGRLEKDGKKLAAKPTAGLAAAGRQAAGAGKQNESREDFIRDQQKELRRVAELARISRQLRLTIPADVLKQQSAGHPRPSPGPVVVQNEGNGSTGQTGGRKTAQKGPVTGPLQVLFIIVCDEK